jgi:NAD(P)-dependent dehydrogenase (short-subunit alcohol dehydrogenase family)
VRHKGLPEDATHKIYKNTLRKQQHILNPIITMSPITTVMITGANVGLGYDTARQLALTKGVKKVILACRNPDKAKAAKQSLEKITDKRIFEILIMDVSNLDSVRKAVNSLDEPIDGLVMNAGGIGGKEPGEMTEYGVPAVIAVNVLGHVLLVDLLLEQNKLSGTVIFSGSEAARGVPLMGMKKYEFKSGSVAEFESMNNGSAYKKKTMEEMYGPAKLVGTFWMPSMARRHPDIRFINVSAGGTTGTTFEYWCQ